MKTNHNQTDSAAKGLYDPRFEHDACGVGFVANISGEARRDIIDDGLEVLGNLSHRGAVGADPQAGDGAGIALQLPHRFFVDALEFALPPRQQYAVGMMFMPRADALCDEIKHLVERRIRAHELQPLGWRRTPTDSRVLSASVAPTEPQVWQVFIARGDSIRCADEFERKLFVMRRQIEADVYRLDNVDTVNDAAHDGHGDSHSQSYSDFYIASLSCRTIIYKGMLRAEQLSHYYLELRDDKLESALALVHQRFSTNTFPAWRLAHPYRLIAHNGEINTLRGNINWMAARRGAMTSERIGDALQELWPLIADGSSDSAAFDNALELLLAGGYSLARAMMTLIPEAWGAGDSLSNTSRDTSNHSSKVLMSPTLRAFYQHHAALMEPWDGPSAVAFTDGNQIGAMLDRNGLRPARYLVTRDGKVVMASEAGVLEVAEKNIVRKWRLQPGKMLLIDLQQGRIIDDFDIKTELATARDYQRIVARSQIELHSLGVGGATVKSESAKVDKANGESVDETVDEVIDKTIDKMRRMQRAFGWTREALTFVLAPMMKDGAEAIGSMGADSPPAVLSKHAKPLAHYFKQNFAQVTNPPIDPIRESLVMSLLTMIGPKPNLLGDVHGDAFDDDANGMRLIAPTPVLTCEQLARIRRIDEYTDGALNAHALDVCFAHADGAVGMRAAIVRLCDAAESAVREMRAAKIKRSKTKLTKTKAGGDLILILSDRAIDAQRIAIPALLAVSAVHHHLINCGLRTAVGLIVESGACFEVHHLATLAGYGAEAVNPYLAFDAVAMLAQQNESDESLESGESVKSVKSVDEAHANYRVALDAGLKKVMSKMGISTYQSYCGAQIFDAVGLSEEFIADYFCGTHSAVGGVGLDAVAADVFAWHADAYGESAAPAIDDALDVGGDYAYRVRGEAHVWTPETVGALQKSARANSQEEYAQFARAVDAQHGAPLNLRGLFAFTPHNAPIALDEVESAREIVKRFSTGAMSYGSISHEAHTNLARAMNRLGGKSNTGEGGEQRERYLPLPDGAPNPNRSAIKQIASGRFGVTCEYLVNAADLQIKMAQGAKPGEGGQLPGHKVDEQIAAVRHSTPGVGLISPPPHHDIYSIEDLAQLIYDLKNVNPDARISVKLVAETGVGTVAAGVAKAHADHVTIAGNEGGTGASPLTSIRHAGAPWEIGLAETQQTLMRSGLRARIAVQVDGGLRTGRDVAVGALLGADEFGFATAPLIASGCLMMRKCHLNTCPVGVATQDPQLRARFGGQPEHVINYFFFVAEHLREIMASLGFRTVDEMIGQTHCLDMRAALAHSQSRDLDYSRILAAPDAPHDAPRRRREAQQHGLEDALDVQLMQRARAALEHRQSVQIDIAIANRHRAIGAMLSGALVRKHGGDGLPDDTIRIRARGSAGQSFGAWLARGVTLELCGEANDYVGKGLSGGRVIVYPPSDSGIGCRSDNIIVGNTVLYGATSGECFFSGVAGERFAVRNSGAVAVVEGVGDHGCEYMTGGVVVCLGATGRNFAAGMSGGIAYVLDEHGAFAAHCNQQQLQLEAIAVDGGVDVNEIDVNKVDINKIGANKVNDGNVDADIDINIDIDNDIDDPLGADETRLNRLIKLHARYTNSQLAQRVLDNWRDYLPRFVKVMPLEYRRALLARRAVSAQQDAQPNNRQREPLSDTQHG